MAMAEEICSTCRRCDGDLEPRSGEDESRNVGLLSIHASASSCKICAFVYTLIRQDTTTPNVGHESYQSSMVRVDEGGLRFTGQWQGALVIEVYKEGSQPKLPGPKFVPEHLSCDFAAGIINKWMSICEGDDECNKNSLSWNAKHGLDGERREPQVLSKNEIGASLPKRLIKLDDDLKSTRLVLYPAEIVSYAALSYCWGISKEGETSFKTDEHTLSGFEKEIPIGDLPQTIKDAFALTKKLGIDYLWVDAICIVQGSQQEWEQESGKMGRIYTNAKIVLSSTQSAHVNDGMFRPRSTTSLSEDIAAPGGLMWARRNMNHEIITSCRTKSNKWWETNINNTFPVLSRGWCFQERLLATRIVHFTPTELVWECQKTRMCECCVVQSNLYPAKNNMASALRICLDEDVGERGIRQMWREIVRSYSVRKLTELSDKLPAISGVAALFSKKTGDMYAAGLWKASLPFDLLWRCDQSGDLKWTKERVPSWSWISVDGAVKWPVSRELDAKDPLELQAKQPLEYLKSSTYFELGPGGAEGVEVCEVVCDSDGQNEFGQVDSGRITLKTRLIPVTIQPVWDEKWNELYETEWSVRVAEIDSAPVWLDILLNKSQTRHFAKSALAAAPYSAPGETENSASEMGILYLLEIMKKGNSPWTWEEALLVKLREGLLNEYERIGVAANISHETGKEWTSVISWFKGSKVVEAILV